MKTIHRLRYPRHFSWLLACALALTALSAEAQPLRGRQPQVAVTGPTRLDWIFAVANQSPAQPPADWLPDYDSTAQRYELYVPATVDPRKPAPLVLFISAGNAPAGLGNWQQVCDATGTIFCSPYAAGNSTPMQRRVRIVFDVLDDVRRRFAIDADRTYIGGISGGARVASSIAFSLPEYFGGIVPCCGAESVRDEPWLKQRAVDRLSVALMTGETDFNRGELERLRYNLLSGIGIRTKVWTVAGLGHSIPKAPELAAAFAWLEEGVPERRRKAVQWPAMRLTSEPASREAWSQALLAEGKKRLAAPATLYSGLMQLQGVAARWPDLPAAREATKILTEYDARDARPWEAEDIDEQRRSLLAEARGWDAYASGELPPQYAAQRAGMAEAALDCWRQLLQDNPTSPAGQEARKRIPELMRLVEGTK